MRIIAGTFESDGDITGLQGAYKTKQKKLVARFAQTEIEYRYEIMKENEYIDFIGTYAAAYKKNVFNEMDGFDLSYPIASGEDTEFSFRLTSKGYKLAFKPEAFVFHRHPTSLRKYLKQKYGRAYWRNLIYKTHITKVFKDSYTPQALKLQIVVMGLFFLSLPCLFFEKALRWLPLIPIMLFLLLTLPFLIFALKRDRYIACILPGMVFMRSIVFIIGMGIGFINVVLLGRTGK